MEVKNSYGQTAMHLVASNGHEAVARLLLKNGADIEAKDSYGETALHCAAFHRREAVTQLLLKRITGTSGAATRGWLRTGKRK
jgi:ankyrin repeat protein